MFFRGIVLPIWTSSVGSACSRAEQRLDGPVSLGPGLRREIRVHAIRDDVQAIGRNKPGGDNRVVRGGAVARHARDLLQPAKDSRRHPAKWCRAPLRPGVEHAPERIEIVARDNGPFGRQLVREVRVAVVRDVKEISLVALPAQPARIVEQPVRETIEGKRGCRAAEQWNGGGAAAKRRLQPHRFHVAALPSEALYEHVGHQIHARPALLGQIADDANSQVVPHAVNASKKPRCSAATRLHR